MAETREAASPLRFTTRHIPVPSRHKAMGELREQGLLPIEPLADGTPRADLLKWKLPGASILSGTFAGVRQGGGPGLDRMGDDLFFGINIDGHSPARQREREITIHAGDAVFVDPGAGTFDIWRTMRTQMIGIRLPRRSVPIDTVQSGAAPLRLVPVQTAALQLLTGYLRGALAGSALTSAALADAVVSHVTELIALSLDPAYHALPPTDMRSVRAARLAAVKADIERHLTDSSLTAADLAARHRISTRYLHKLFEDEDMTYSQFVLDRRLALAHRRLRHPRFATRTISAIANDAGFGDLSYFNRTFRRRYNVTPSDVRQAANRPR